MSSSYFSYAVGFIVLFELIILFMIVRTSLRGIARATGFLQEGILVEGRVIDSWQKVVKGNTQFAPIVEYTAMDGKKYTAKGELFRNTLPEMGRQYPVYYKTNDPAIGMIDPAGVKRTSTLLMIVVPLFMLAGTGVMLFFFHTNSII